MVRLKGGDPFVFGRGGEECEALAEAGVRFEVVPGVTSAIAAPAYAGIPLTHRELASSVAFIAGHKRSGAFEEGDGEEACLGDSGFPVDADTLVFLMGVRNLPGIVAGLLGRGRAESTPVALIRWGTRASQGTVTGTLADIVERAREAGLGPPALIVVGEVVRLRERLSWFETKPLFGRRIVVTRSRHQAGDLVRLLEDLGAETIETPTIQIVDPEDWRPVDAAIRRLRDFDWLVLTSANGADRFFGRLLSLGLDCRALASAKVCAIGPATAARIEAHGLRPDLRPQQNVAESVVEVFGRIDLRGRKILIPRGAVARELLPRALADMGAEVTEVKVYRTVRPETRLDELRERLRRGEVDLVTFTSSSTVRHFVEMLSDRAGGGLEGDLARGIRGASIGPITSETAREHGISVVAQADLDDMTVTGLVRAIERHIRENG